MKLMRRRTSLPLGVDIGAGFVSVVAAEAIDDGFALREMRTLELRVKEPLDLAIAETLRELIATLKTTERRCILAAPASDVVTRGFRLPPGMRRGEAERAASLEADTLVDWPASERLVALDPLPGRSDERLLSVARNSTVQRLVAIARAAGLRTVAVDAPACAWRRAVPDADAVLDCATDRAALIVFGEPVGVVHLFPPRLIDERLAANVRAAFVDARRDGLADVQRLAVFGTPYRYESICDLLRGDGYALVPGRLGSHASPAWTFAYGLATWSIAPRGLVAS
jgi:hypothetical protein